MSDPRVLEDKLNKHLHVVDLDYPPSTFETIRYKIYLGTQVFTRPKDVLSLEEFVAIARFYNRFTLNDDLKITDHKNRVNSARKKHQKKVVL